MYFIWLSYWITTVIMRQKAAKQHCMQPTTMLQTSAYVVAHCAVKCLLYTYSSNEQLILLCIL